MERSGVGLFVRGHRVFQVGNEGVGTGFQGFFQHFGRVARDEKQAPEDCHAPSNEWCGLNVRTGAKLVPVAYHMSIGEESPPRHGRRVRTAGPEG